MFKSRKNLVLAMVVALILPFSSVFAKEPSLEDLSDMCDKAYGPKEDLPIEKDGFEVFMRGADSDSGFQGLAYQRDEDGAVFVVFAGTQLKDPKDVLADFGIVGTVAQQGERAILASLKGTFNKIFKKEDTTSKEFEAARKKPLKPNKSLQKQLDIAQKFFEAARKEGKADNKKNLIYVTGHSLGGYLAQVVAADNDVPGYTFNGPGAFGMSKKIGKTVVNHTRKSDLVGTFGMHLGRVKEHPDTPFTLESLSSAYIGKNHSISQFHKYFLNPKKEQHSEIKETAQKAGEVIKDGAVKTGESIKDGAEKTGEFVKDAAQKTGAAVKKGAKKAGKVAKKVGKKIIDFFSGKK